MSSHHITLLFLPRVARSRLEKKFWVAISSPLAPRQISSFLCVPDSISRNANVFTSPHLTLSSPSRPEKTFWVAILSPLAPGQISSFLSVRRKMTHGYAALNGKNAQGATVSGPFRLVCVWHHLYYLSLSILVLVNQGLCLVRKVGLSLTENAVLIRCNSFPSR